VMLLHILRWGRLPTVRVWWRRPPVPLVGARKTVRLLVLRMLVGSHVGSGLLWMWWWWREGVAHLADVHCQQPVELTVGLAMSRGVQAHDDSDLHEGAVDRRRLRAVARWEVANGSEADLGHPGEETFWVAVQKSG
jgi:hypothetical protein